MVKKEKQMQEQANILKFHITGEICFHHGNLIDLEERRSEEKNY